MQKKKAKPGFRAASAGAGPARKTAFLLQQALARHQGGDLNVAESIYRQILAIDARHFDALQFLGMILRGKGELQNALDLLAMAASINPANDTIHASLGNTLLDMGRHADAVASYDRFLLSMPDFAEILNNKANALSALGRESEAMVCYERALRNQPDFPDAYFNRGNLRMDMRQYAEALSDYEHVLSVNRAHFQAWNNRGNTLQKLGKLSAAIQSYQNGLTIAPDNPELHGCLASVYISTGELNEAVRHYCKVLELTTDGFARQNAALQLAILHFVYGDPANLEPMLHIAKDMVKDTHGKDKGSLIYCIFMLKISLWWQDFRKRAMFPPAVGMLYVIGESHMLSAHKLVVNYRGRQLQCKGLWIEGCTQWRIGNADDNHYKQLMASYFQSVPEASSVLIVVGEIDCRIDSGILKANRKTSGISLEQSIQSSILEYLNFIATHAMPRKLNVVIGGVPAYSIDEVGRTQDEMQQFGRFLSLFNSTLKTATSKLGMDFLDVFSLTDGGAGKANQKWHIDAHHLRPDGILEAFAHHLITS